MTISSISLRLLEFLDKGSYVRKAILPSLCAKKKTLASEKVLITLKNIKVFGFTFADTE